MARIRSIKPDFFTSETVASLPLSARLTFIGLWTYVDDNGVGVDHELLINAAIWPLEGDALETIARTREDLAILSRKGLVTRYRDSRKRYLFITSWDEHQKVDHPRKPRYPRPGNPASENAPASEDTNPREDVAKDSRGSRDDLAPEQGAGSREQGSGKALGRQARRAWKTAVTRRGADPKAVILAAQRYRDDPRRRSADIGFTAHPATWLNGERWLEHTDRPALQRPAMAWDN